ncbi:MAG: protein kinase, partial [Anaerolineales bacterium]
MTLSLPERRIELPPPPAGLSPPTPSLPSTSETLLGAQLDEYRLDTLLGKGGMARVYRGLDPKLRRYVAIKVIDTPFRADSDHIMRFEREAQAIAQLEHPNIVRLYRYGEANGLLYMAMQYIKGADLQAVIASYREDGELIPLEGAVRIVQEICHALDYMHSKGVIHRDVTPSNIMLNEDGQAILTDFGLVLLTDISTRGKIFGSPHYIAPEQAISSAGAVPQSDLYSVGVILYELLTGEVPFDAEETLEIAMQHMSDLPRPPRELREAIRPEIEAVVLKALAKEPENRHPTGVALAADLAAALELTRAASPLLSTQPRPGLSVPERVATQLAEDPLPSISEALKPEKKRRGSWAVVGVSSLVLATAVLIGWFFFVDKRLPNPFQFAAAPIPTETAMPPATKTNTTTPTASGSGLTGPAQTPTPSPSPTFTLEPSPTPSTELKASPTESPTATPSPTPIPATS